MTRPAPTSRYARATKLCVTDPIDLRTNHASCCVFIKNVYNILYDDDDQHAGGGGGGDDNGNGDGQLIYLAHDFLG